MGIKGLLKTLKPIENKTHLKNFKGKKMGIDTYCWLHKSAHIFGEYLADNPDDKKYLIILKKLLFLLLKYEIIPIFVFDGNKIRIKNAEEDKREYKREMIKNEINLLNSYGFFIYNFRGF